MEQINLTANVTFSDGKSQQISTGLEWHSTDNLIVRVSPEGQAKAVTQGSAEIYAKYHALEAPPVRVIVEAPKVSLPLEPKLVSIHVLAPNKTSKSMQQIALRLRATSSDGNKTDVLNAVTWTSSDLRVAFVDSAGNVLTRNTGAVQITAFYDGLPSSPVTLTVKDKVPAPTQRLPAVDLTAALRRANDFYENGKYTDAINELDKILKSKPQNGEPSALRGKVLNACRREGLCGRQRFRRCFHAHDRDTRMKRFVVILLASVLQGGYGLSAGTQLRRQRASHLTN